MSVIRIKKIRVSFGSDSVALFSDDIRRHLSSSYVRGLVPRCSSAHQEIFTILTTTGLKLEPLNDQTDPLLVRNPNVAWDEDDSPLTLAKELRQTPHLTQEICRQIMGASGPDGLRSVILQNMSITVRVNQDQ